MITVKIKISKMVYRLEKSLLFFLIFNTFFFAHIIKTKKKKEQEKSRNIKELLIQLL